jgi:transcriptional regulator GlxA family with amidase domain
MTESHGEPRRQSVYFVLLPQTLLLDVAGPAEALRMANRYQDAVRFDLRFVGPRSDVPTSIGLCLTKLAPLPRALPDDAMIVVAGTVDPPGRTGAGPAAAKASGGEEPLRRAQAAVVAWLRRIVRPSHRLACICSGALLGARAGLLDGRAVTTHHSDCDELRALAPTARVADDRIFVVDGNVATSAGVTAGLDLMLHLLGEIAGPLCALAVARNMVVYLRRSGADPQLSPWLEGRNHLHPAVHRVQDAITADPSHSWTLHELAALAHTSPRHLTRLFARHAGVNPLEYIHHLRVALARDLLANSQLDLERVAEQAGFGSSRQLRRVWRKYDPLPPSRARNQAASLKA